MTAGEYLAMLQRLLPPGKVWRLDAAGIVSEILLANADELVRLHGRTDDLLVEVDPRTADELLPDFERMLALPSTGTLDERRARVVGKLILRQRVRPVDYQQALGPILGQDPGDVVVLENSRAFAIATGDDRAIYLFHVYRDPAAPGTYDLAGAQALIDSVEHSHTRGKVIESIDFKCDDPYSLCDRDLLGV